MASTSTKVTLKLLIDTKNQKVLFAEASKAVIDFLFNLLRLLVGTVVRLLSKNGMVMATEVRYVGKKVAEENISIKSGFVKEIVTFMVMDDLVVEPMSTISSITLLNKFNVKEVGTLQEKVVELGMPEGLMLLKAALQTKMALTSVFLKKN
ncbi:hypothetical protein SESBI_04421 [Sesbania bispinosa]|nr:hypothetical protein SESBI_04421 [Sesbania bispinosa]